MVKYRVCLKVEHPQVRWFDIMFPITCPSLEAIHHFQTHPYSEIADSVRNLYAFLHLVLSCYITYIYIYIHTYVRTYVRPYVHAYIHTYLYIYIIMYMYI